MASPYMSLAPVSAGGDGGGVDAEARAQLLILSDEVASVSSIASSAVDAVDAAEVLIAALDTRIDILEAAPPPSSALPSWDLQNKVLEHYTDTFGASNLSYSATYIALGDAPRATMPKLLGTISNVSATSIGEPTVSAVLREAMAVLAMGDFECTIQLAVSALPTATASCLFRCGLTSKPTYNGTPNTVFLGFEFGGSSAEAIGLRPRAGMSAVNYKPTDKWYPMTVNEPITARITWNKTTKLFTFYINDMDTPWATYTFPVGTHEYSDRLYGYYARAAKEYGTSELSVFCHVDSFHLKQTLDTR